MSQTFVHCQEKLCITDAILEKYTLATLTTQYIHVKVHQNKYKDDAEHAQLQSKNLVFPFAKTHVIPGVVCDSRFLYKERSASKKIVELTINYPDHFNNIFSPGDTIGIVVPNTKTDVEAVLNSLNLLDNCDNLCEVFVKPNTTKKNVKVPAYIPLQTSIRAIIRDCLELRSIPKKLFLRSLVEYTSALSESGFLGSISSKEGSQLYTKYILEKALTFLDILKLCPSCCPPLSLLIEHLPRLKPRPYSIANSPLAKDHKVKFIFSILPDNPGVATKYLGNIAEMFRANPTCPLTVNFYFRESSKFIYSIDDAKCENILIGVGCGVSPFLGFLENKSYLREENQMELGSTWLFIGSKCQANTLYRNKLLEYKKSGVLQELFESFSQGTNSVQLKHVQDQIKENAKKFVMQLSKKNTTLYVCADGNAISKSIENCIKECLMDIQNCSKDEAEIFIKDSRINGKYREDLWI